MALSREERLARRKANRRSGRMAGDALAETSEAADLSSAEAAPAPDGMRNNLERRIGTDEYTRIGARGQDDATGKGKYSAKEVISEFRNREKGTSVDGGEGSMVDYFQGLVNDGAKFNGRAKNYLTKHGVTFGGGGGGGGGEDGSDPSPTPEPTPAPTPAPTPTPGPPQTIQPGGPTTPNPFSGNSQTQNINQDNDLNVNVTGSNNTTISTQDNSISQGMGSSDYASRYARGLKDQYVLNLLNR